MENQKYIVCAGEAGIGNRLRGLISAIRLCRLTNRKLLLYWKNSKHLGCDFNDLFENKFKEINKEELDEIKKKNSKVYKNVLEPGWEEFDYIILKTWKFIFLPGEIETGFSEVSSEAEIDFKFGRIPLKIRNDISMELSRLHPTKEILEMVKSFKLDLSEYNGMHIRRGDTKFTVEGKEKISSDEKFIKIIEENPNEKFFISTDSIGVAKGIKEKFGERICYYPSKDKKRSNKESIQEALVAIILLAKTKHLYGSFLSTFTEMVWWFSGCNIEVDIVGIEDVTEDFYLKINAKKTFYQKVRWKLKFYKVIFLRWIFGY